MSNNPPDEFLTTAVRLGFLPAQKLGTTQKLLRDAHSQQPSISIERLLVARGLLTETQVLAIIEKMSTASGEMASSGATQTPSVSAIDLDDLKPAVRPAEDSQTHSPTIPSPQRIRKPLWPPSRPLQSSGFERFQILESIGSGAQGAVFRAVDPNLNRELAIKRMRDSSDTPSRNSFVEEAQISGQLDHPNIVPIYEMGVDASGLPYLAMKRIVGQDFRKIINEAHAAQPARDSHPAPPIPNERELLESFLKICDAVRYAHSRGVIHRDLKPSNVMVGEFGEVWVLDWGLAKPIGAAERQRPVRVDRDPYEATIDGDIFGTPAYMPPEQAFGRTDDIDERSDIYSLGATLYTILTGHAPYQGATAMEIVTDVRQRPCVPPSQHPGARFAIPPELEAVTMKAMARTRESRYQSVAKLRADIDAYLDGRIPSVADFSPWHLLRKWMRRHWRRVAIAVGILVAVGIGVTLAVYMADQARQQERQRQAAELQAWLDAREAVLVAWDADVAAIDRQIADGNFAAAIAADDAFAIDRADTMAALQADERIREHRPEILARLHELVGRVGEQRHRAIRAWATTFTDIIDRESKAVSDADFSAVESGFENLFPFCAESGLADLPVSRLALWRAQQAVAAGDQETAHRWVANAYRAQPESESAGRAMLLLAQQTLPGAADFDDQFQWGSIAERAERAATQFHLAWSAFGDAYPVLAVEALLGMAQALAQMGPLARAPFAADVSAREMAVRALLRIVDAKGNPRADLPPNSAAMARDASDLLFVLGQMTAATPIAATMLPFDADADGVCESWYDHEAARSTAIIVRYEMEFPTVPGCDGARLVRTAAIDANPLIARYWADRGGNAISIERCASLGTALGFPAYLMILRHPVSRDLRVVLLDRPDSTDARAVWTFAGGLDGNVIYSTATAVGDVDGNGFADIVLGCTGSHRAAYCCFQSPGRQFSDPVPICVGNEVEAAIVADLDGDGRVEIAATVGLWGGLKLEIFRFSSATRRIESVASHRLGMAFSLVPRQLGRETRVLTQSFLSTFAARRCFPATTPLPPLGVAEFRFASDELESVSLTPEPPTTDAERIGKYIVRWLAPSEWRSWGRTAFLECTFADGHLASAIRRSCRWWHESESTFPLARAVEIFGEAPYDRAVSVPGSFATQTPGDIRMLYRVLSPADLAELATREIPNALVIPWRHAAVSIGHSLLQMGLAAQAAQVAGEGLANLPSTADAETRHQLLGLRLIALATAGQFSELQRELNGEVPIAADLADAVVVAAERLALDHLDYVGAAKVLARWAMSSRLPPALRAILETQSRRWRELADRFASPSVSIRGTEILMGRTTARVADYILANNLHQLLPHDTTDSAAAPGLEFRISGRPARHTFDGQTLTATLPMTGIPVVFHGGSIRLTVDVEIRGISHGCNVQFGLFPLDCLVQTEGTATRPPFSFLVACGGGNAIHTTVMGHMRSRLDLTALVGHRMRVEMEFLADVRQIRLTIRDATSGQILAKKIEFDVPPPASGNYLLGICEFGASSNQCFGTLHELALNGHFAALAPDTREVRAFTGDSATLEAIAKTMRAIWADDAPGIASHLTRAADLWQSGADANSHRLAAEMRIECAWRTQSPQTFAEYLAGAITDDIHRTALENWLDHRPAPTGTLDPWALVGQMFLRQLYPNDTPATVMNRLQTDFDANHIGSVEWMAITAALAREDSPVGAHALLHHLHACFVGRVNQRERIFALGDTLAVRRLDDKWNRIIRTLRALTFAEWTRYAAATAEFGRGIRTDFRVGQRSIDDIRISAADLAQFFEQNLATIRRRLGQ